MHQGSTIRKKRQGGRVSLLALLLGLLFALHPYASAQVSSYGDKNTGESYGNELPSVLKGAAIDQHLNATLPDVPFTAETGKAEAAAAGVIFSAPPSQCCEDVLAGCTHARRRVPRCGIAP